MGLYVLDATLPGHFTGFAVNTAAVAASLVWH
jgi:hypothetical protein